MVGELVGAAVAKASSAARARRELSCTMTVVKRCEDGFTCLVFLELALSSYTTIVIVSLSGGTPPVSKHPVGNSMPWCCRSPAHTDEWYAVPSLFYC